MVKKWFFFLLIIINVCLYLVTIGCFITLSEYMAFNLGLMGVSLALTTGLLLQKREYLKKYYQSPQFRYLSGAMTSLVLVIGILAILNYLVFKNPIQWDLSERKTNSLTDQSQKVMSQIKKPLTFHIFTRQKEKRAIQALLDLYRFVHSDMKMTWHDPEMEPGAVAEYKITKVPSLVIESEGRKVLVEDISELEITNGLIKITRKELPKVYFLSGHGNSTFIDKHDQGLSYLYSIIKEQHYDVETIAFPTIKKIPTEVKAVILWGPKDALFDGELKVLADYLDRGGQLILALPPQFGKDVFGNLRAFLQKRGIQLSNSLVIDHSNFVNGSKGTVPIASYYNNDHALTKGFTGTVFFPLASMVSATKGSDFKILISTNDGPQSYAKMNLAEYLAGKKDFTEGVDVEGPIGVAGVLENEENKSKILIFGNDSFVHNIYQKFGRNYTLFLNGLSHMVDEGKLASFNLPALKSNPIFINPTQLGVIFYFSVLIAPFFLFSTGAFFYWRGRQA